MSCNLYFIKIKNKKIGRKLLLDIIMDTLSKRQMQICMHTIMNWEPHAKSRALEF